MAQQVEEHLCLDCIDFFHHWIHAALLPILNPKRPESHHVSLEHKNQENQFENINNASPRV